MEVVAFALLHLTHVPNLENEGINTLAFVHSHFRFGNSPDHSGPDG